ncbi:DUF58 domain-containing protein [Candidatus Woesearchaeota archaeon]|nr:DUF58 domain-containing protein [Candidatus Woesearchaeota archaeon]
MIDTAFLRQLDRFHLVLKKRVLSNYQGERQSHAQGSGLTFADYKDYVPGDDFRNIDWKVFARTNKLYIKKYEEERDLSVHIIVDASSSMDYGKQIKKFEYASMIGIGFAYMALKNNEKFNFSTFADQLNYFKAKKGMNQLLEIIKRLEKQKITGNSKLEGAFEEYKKFMHNKGFVVVISDFLYDLEEIKSVISRFTKHEVVIIQVLDPEERKLALYGDVMLEDSEMHTKLRTFISNRLLKNYREKLEGHIYSIKDACEKMGADFISITSDRPIFEAFYAALKV